LTPPPGNSGSRGEEAYRRRVSWNRRSLALLGSFCFFLATIEYLIPKPLPFMRIGLANLPLILALDLFPPGPFALLVLIKISGQALITGTLFSYVFLFSLAGSTVSALVMYSLRRFLGKNRIGFTGAGIAGAVLSNLVQLGLARTLVFGEGVRFLAPLFLASGLISGGVLGFFCETFAARSRWYKRVLGGDTADGAPAGSGHAADAVPGPGAVVPEPSAAVGPAGEVRAYKPAGGTGEGGAGRSREARRLKRREQWNRLFQSRDLFAAGLIIMLIFLFTSSLVFKILQFLFFRLLCSLSGKKDRPLMTLLLMLGIVGCNLLVPYGKILIHIGPLQISQGALLSGLRRALTLEGLIMLSGAFIRADLRFPGAFGALLSESFRIFALLQERRRFVNRKHFIEGIDELMIELDRDMAEGAPGYDTNSPAGNYPRPGTGGTAESGGGKTVPARRHPASLPLLAAMILLSALLAAADEGAFLQWAGHILGPVPE
jgi:heptaprenyl diphosphate synthase